VKSKRPQAGERWNLAGSITRNVIADPQRSSRLEDHSLCKVGDRITGNSRSAPGGGKALAVSFLRSDFSYPASQDFGSGRKRAVIVPGEIVTSWRRQLEIGQPDQFAFVDL
jgi:hypothetical protein